MRIFSFRENLIKMSKAFTKPKVTLEVETGVPGVLIVGKDSVLLSQLREILISKGMRVNDTGGFDYVFQLGDLEKIAFFLEKAKNAGAKFLLILDESVKTREAKKAETQAESFIKNQKLEGKIIRLRGFSGQEIAAVGKILKIVFSQTPEEVITLTGAGALFPKTSSPKKLVVSKKFFSWSVAFISLCFLVTLPLTFFLANLFLGTWALQNTKEAVLTSDFARGRSQAKTVEEDFVRTKNSFAMLKPIFNLLGNEDEGRQIEAWLEIGQNLGGVSRYLIDVGQEGQNLALLISGQKQGEIKESLAKIKADIGLVTRELAMIETQVPVGPSFLVKNFAAIKEIRKGLVTFESFLPVTPWILGIAEKRTFLILLQNNFELRPGGGFIGTIGLLTFADGKMDLKIEDVYTADGQLSGHVEPPSPLKQYLGQIHWYLRDSNWEPDFPTNAQKAAWFYEKEMGIKPDGVIALDLFLAQKILAATGPVDLGDYQEKISADNLFLKAQIYSQEKFFPGSTQKRDFLGALANALFSKIIRERQPTPWFSLAKAAGEAIEEKHLAIWFNHSLAEKLISEQGGGGEIKHTTCNIKHVICVEDYLMIVDANLGVNKSNYFVKREIKKELNLAGGNLASQIIINYENTSPAGVSFAGDYKNYLRMLVPTDFVLEKVKIDEQDLGANQVDQENLDAKKLIGFLVQVKPGEKKKVEALFKRPLNLSAKEFTYELLVQKQAGTDKDGLIIASNFGLSYDGDLLIDRIFEIKLKK